MKTLSIRKIVVAGVMSAVVILLGVTRWGFLPWFAGASLTIMHVPVIVAAVLEGPLVGLIVGLIFGVFSLIQASMPNVQMDPAFLNPLISILPRLFIGPVAWLAYRALKRYEVLALIVAGIAGSFTNTVLVLGMIGLLGLYPWAVLIPIVWANGLPEAGVAAIITLAVVSAWLGIGRRRKQADL
ncbi:MAG: ECF transporter S component [Anaerolineae bacterium]|nr:ECF transporter S component [Anaerolineae bacterium]